MQQLKKFAKVAIVVVAVIAGVQFSLAYINRLQLKNIMDAEALDGRRAKHSSDEILRNVTERARKTGIHLPEDAEIIIEGTGGGENDLWISIEYVHQVDLFVRKVPVHMYIEANAAPPIN